MGKRLSNSARELLLNLSQMSPSQYLMDYDRKAYSQLEALGFVGWEPCGWAGIGIQITSQGRAFLASASIPELEAHTWRFSDPEFSNSFAA